MRTRMLLGWALFWTLAGLFFASESYLAGVVLGRPVAWAPALAYSLSGWYAWALLAPAIVRLGRAVPIRRGRLAYAGVVHVGASALFGLAHAALEVGAQRLLGSGVASGSYLAALRPRLQAGSHLDLVTYWAILGVSYALAYYRREHERELRASRLAAGLAEARLELLRVQLDPHFLFNALNAISALLHSEPEAADRMIARVGELLRVSLEGRGRGRQEVPLREELRLLELYAGIERARFRGRVAIDVDASPELLDARVPSLLLQPLVENAIRHGIAPRAGPGRVCVTVRRAGDSLEITVGDDGLGLATSSPNGSGGIGLENTRARLAQLYGPAHSFEIGRREGGGLLVRLRLPLRDDPAVAPAAVALEAP